MKKITILIPVFNEMENVLIIYDAVRVEFDKLQEYSWDMLFVDDGSSDETWERILKLSADKGNVAGIQLSRNFGKEMALTAGVEHVSGVDAVLCMDADLQHPPTLIPQIIKKWEEGYEVVACVRESCEDYSYLKRIGSAFFYSAMIRFSTLKLTKGSTDFRLLDKKVVDSLLQINERNRIFRGITDWVGFSKAQVSFCAPARGEGSSSFNFKKLAGLGITSFTYFSLFPLKVLGVSGGIIMGGGFLLLMYMFLAGLFKQNAFTPLAYFVVFNSFLAGIILVAISLLAVYVGQIHREVLGRPKYIIRKTNMADKRVE